MLPQTQNQPTSQIAMLREQLPAMRQAFAMFPDDDITPSVRTAKWLVNRAKPGRVVLGTVAAYAALTIASAFVSLWIMAALIVVAPVGFIAWGLRIKAYMTVFANNAMEQMSQALGMTPEQMQEMMMQMQAGGGIDPSALMGQMQAPHTTLEQE